MTSIEWTQRPGTKGETWNPIRARDPATGKVGWFCAHASEGCRNCYAEAMNGWRGNGLAYKAQHRGKVEIFLDEKTLRQPLHWRKPRTVFPCSMTDLFGEFVPEAMLDRIFAVMALTPQHSYQVLTKRAGRMRDYLTRPIEGGWAGRVTRDGAPETGAAWRVAATMRGMLIGVPAAALNRAIEWQDAHQPGDGFMRRWPLPNLWLGVSVENRETADRIDDLRHTPAALRFLSLEPLLEDLGTLDFEAIDWVICGGESGPRARPLRVDWVRSIVAQCGQAGVPCFVKQLGAQPRWNRDEPEFRLRDRKGGDPAEWPADLRVRQYPDLAPRTAASFATMGGLRGPDPN